MNTVGQNRVMYVLSLITSAGLVLFWIGFFTVGIAPDRPPACYFAYEHSFPLPDILLALVLLVGAIMGMKGKTSAKVLLIAAGGALSFLGLLDFSFNIQNGMYTISAMDLVLNAFINLWTLIFGIALVVKLR